MANKQFLQKPWLILLAATGVIGILVIGVFCFSHQQVAPLRSRIEALDRIKPNNFPELEKLAQQQKALIDTESAVRAPLIQAIVGIAATIATSTAAFIAFQNYQATQEKNAADRFSKAVEQLGNENIHVRLGGIFALEQIANTEDKYYWQIMEILTAYVRTRSPWPEKEDKRQVNLETGEIEKIAEDIQSVITVLSNRRQSYQNGEQSPLNLSRVDLRSCLFVIFSDFKGANFSHSNLSQTRLSSVNLSHALFEEADLSKANLMQSELLSAFFRNSNISGARFSENLSPYLSTTRKMLDAKNLTWEQIWVVKDQSYNDAILPSYLPAIDDEIRHKLESSCIGNHWY